MKDEQINYKFWTVVMIQNRDEVLLLNRQHDDFKGYIPPGGKVEFPERFSDGAIREVKEETGLEVCDLKFKGISEFVNPATQDRYIMFNYWTNQYKGEQLEEPPEGELMWVKIAELDQYPMQEDIRKRIHLFFSEGTFEVHTIWDEKLKAPKETYIRHT